MQHGHHQLLPRRSRFGREWVSGIGGNAGCFGKRTGGGVGKLFGFLLGVEPQNPLKREYIFGELWLESWEIHNILPCHTLIWSIPVEGSEGNSSVCGFKNLGDSRCHWYQKQLRNKEKGIALEVSRKVQGGPLLVVIHGVITLRNGLVTLLVISWAHLVGSSPHPHRPLWGWEFFGSAQVSVFHHVQVMFVLVSFEEGKESPF